MSTIFELTEKQLMLAELLSDPDIDEQTLKDTMEAVGGEVEEKFNGYKRVIDEKTAGIDARKALIKALTEKNRTEENNINRMKKNIEGYLIETDTKKVKTPFVTMAMQKNPPKVVIDKPEDVPEDLKVYAEPTVDKKALKELLLNPDTAQFIDYAHLEVTESLRIR